MGRHCPGASRNKGALESLSGPQMQQRQETAKLSPDPSPSAPPACTLPFLSLPFTGLGFLNLDLSSRTRAGPSPPDPLLLYPQESSLEEVLHPAPPHQVTLLCRVVTCLLGEHSCREALIEGALTLGSVHWGALAGGALLMWSRKLWKLPVEALVQGSCGSTRAEEHSLGSTRWSTPAVEHSLGSTPAVEHSLGEHSCRGWPCSSETAATMG